MYNHKRAVFNNSCLKSPNLSISSMANCPKKYLNQLQNEAMKLECAENSADLPKNQPKNPVKLFIDFYDSIPDYDDVNHLSNREFYKKLENLKEQQRNYCEYLQKEERIVTKDTDWIEDYKNLSLKPKKDFCGTPILNRKLCEDAEFIGDNKPPSRRSVRIETPSDKFDSSPKSRPKSRMNLSSANSANSSKPELVLENWEDYSLDGSKSAPNSPRKSQSGGITIPKPFQMTVRDEENQIVEELMVDLKKPEKNKKTEVFKAHEVPIESQIPLFDKIMADQEKKNFLVREKRKAALQAQMRPFSFTRRDEEIQDLTKRLSKSSPSLFEDPPLKIQKFKAKPIPKNLFSNYVYRKMHEDEFYRTLQKKIRAEEMLKAASLPPSMARRERTNVKYDVCPRSYKMYNNIGNSPTKVRKVPNFQKYHEKYEKEIEDLKNEFISTSPRPFKFKSSSKRNERKKKKSSSASGSTKSNFSLPLSSVSRSNLAALLRIQSARQRLEMEMIKKLEEAQLKEEARWKEKLMRKKPVWEALAYSHEEDLAMRLQMRRDEDRLRNEEHKLRMELMLSRVNQQPTLFERQSLQNLPKTKSDVMDVVNKMATNRKKIERNTKRSVSDLSEMVEMKDEAIQAFLEENMRHCNKSDSFESQNNSNSDGEKQISEKDVESSSDN